MCLPFCCGKDDHGPPSQGAGTGMRTTPDHPGDGQTEPVIPSSVGNGKESQKGNGASENKNGGDSNGGNMGSPPRPPRPLPPPPPPQFNEDWAAEQTDTSTTPSGQAPHPRSPPAVHASKHGDQKMVESPEHRDRILTKSTPATKGPKQLEHVIAAGPHHQGTVASPQPNDVTTGTLRTPPSPQLARRGREDDGSYPSAAPTVPAPAPNDGLGDRGHDDDHAYGGKDDRRPPGKSRR